MTDVTPMGLLALFNALTLLVTSLLLLYPVLRYAPNVANTTGFVTLSVAFFLLTGAALKALLWGYDGTTSPLILAAALLALAGSFSFARPFLPRVGRQSPVKMFRGDDDTRTEQPAFEGGFDGGGGS
jgi:hypothetical protein